MRVQPRSQREGIEAVHDGRLKVRLSAPPVDDKANTALLTLLAREFKVPRQSIRITHGVHSHHKTVSLPCPAALPDWFIDLRAAVACPNPSL